MCGIAQLRETSAPWSEARDQNAISAPFRLSRLSIRGTCTVVCSKQVRGLWKIYAA